MSPVACKALRLGLALSLAGATLLAAAQSRSVKPVPQPTAPAAGSALPSPSGLASPFPAGLPSPLANPAGLPDPTVPNISVPGTPAGSPPIDGDVAANPPTGGLAYGRGAVQSMGAGPAGPYTAVQLAQSFLNADVNGDGELTRAEAMRLSIAPYTFEQMDRNYDGVISRFEYEDAVR